MKQRGYVDTQWSLRRSAVRRWAGCSTRTELISYSTENSEAPENIEKYHENQRLAWVPPNSYVRLGPKLAEGNLENALPQKFTESTKKLLLCPLVAFGGQLTSRFPLSPPSLKCQGTDAGAPPIFHYTMFKWNCNIYYSSFIYHRF
jgi:hypothetical protein